MCICISIYVCITILSHCKYKTILITFNYNDLLSLIYALSLYLLH